MRVYILLLSVAWAQPLVDPSTATDVPSLTLWADGDLPLTTAYARRPAPAVVLGPWLDLPVTVWHSGPPHWTPARLAATLGVARYALSACKIRLRDSQPRQAAPRWLVRPRRAMYRSADPNETLAVFRPPAAREDGKRPLGFQRGSQVHTFHSIIYTTFVHEMGHRLGLKHEASPYNLMTTGPIFWSSPEAVVSAGVAFMDPKRFRFEPAACRTMRARLERGLRR